MAISVVQRNKIGDAATGSCSVAFGSNVAAGNALIVVGATDANVNSSLSTPTDTLGHKYQLLDFRNDNTFVFKLWIAYQCLGGANTVTMSDASNDSNLFIFEVSGLAFRNAFDGSSYNSQSSATSLTSNSTANTRYPNELLIGITGNAATTGLAPTLGAGYSNLQTLTTAFMGGGSEEQIVSATGTYSATFGLAVNTTSELTAVYAFSDTPIRPSFKPNSLRPHPFSPGLAR